MHKSTGWIDTLIIWGVIIGGVGFIGTAIIMAITRELAIFKLALEWLF